MESLCVEVPFASLDICFRVGPQKKHETSLRGLKVLPSTSTTYIPVQRTTQGLSLVELRRIQATKMAAAMYQRDPRAVRHTS